MQELFKAAIERGASDIHRMNMFNDRRVARRPEMGTCKTK